ncbi:sulfotransferase family 2 domain-containing protein [Ruegeria sp. HKCCE4150]|uniref:sulfotransferase family 2 domain-containing protein n=1 Tax=Ruegeria sp. HKCCE4150 TaxID=2794828 RepID=UPI001AE1AB70|nr:sulfotransferase family 2 domain-containing protein [Ruegeria sp. HKCCE4150]
MAAKYDYFVVLAAMRTGSNLLEANLNALDSVTCHGEAFNPHFAGNLQSDTLLGLTLEDRDADPMKLLKAIRTAPGDINGFRYFEEHDPRILKPVLNDHRCAKIILTRNPLDSYLSLKIARTTQQWLLKNVKRRVDAQVTFDAQEFLDYLEQVQSHQHMLRRHLQKTGQSAFFISYEDLTEMDVLNGLAEWLGVKARLTRLDDTLKPQNPAPAVSKVTNPDNMTRALADVDQFGLHHTSRFEPQRGAAVPQYVAAPKSALMYLPIRNGLEAVINQWLADLDGGKTGDLITDRNRKQIRAWLRNHTGHRKFTVLRHPLARAHTAFCQHILSTGPGSYKMVRNYLRNRLKVPIPGQVRDTNYSVAQHRDAFLAFLGFLRLNLNNQTPIRVDGTWCSQSRVLDGISGFLLPDLILREEDLTTALPALARDIGHSNPPKPSTRAPDEPFTLDQIYDAELEALAEDVYQHDYEVFGFGAWAPVPPRDAK